MAVVLLACSATPSRTDAPAPSWTPAAVNQPDEVTAGQSLDPGVQCHPCHFLAENQFTGIGAGPKGVVAVGVQKPPGQAIAFLSTDGRTFTPAASFATDAATSAAAIAPSTDGTRTVIVGSNTDGATAWLSTDGGPTWHQAPKQASLLVPYVAGAMTSVVALDAGFVAGGYRDDPLHNRAKAAIWRSSDGLTWQADDAGDLFDG